MYMASQLNKIEISSWHLFLKDIVPSQPTQSHDRFKKYSKKTFNFPIFLCVHHAFTCALRHALFTLAMHSQRGSLNKSFILRSPSFTKYPSLYVHCSLFTLRSAFAHRSQVLTKFCSVSAHRSSGKVKHFRDCKCSLTVVGGIFIYVYIPHASKII